MSDEHDPLLPDRLLSLPPGLMLVIGLAMAAVGLGFTAWGLLNGRAIIILGLFTFTGALGVGMCLTALRDLREEMDLARQLRRIDSEWPAIRAAIRAAEAEGKSTLRALKPLGIGHRLRPLIEARLADELREADRRLRRRLEG